MNPSTALATVVVDELVRAGVREAVLCPGSRSAPFAYALQDADVQAQTACSVRVLKGVGERGTARTWTEDGLADSMAHQLVHDNRG